MGLRTRWWRICESLLSSEKCESSNGNTCHELSSCWLILNIMYLFWCNWGFYARIYMILWFFACHDDFVSILLDTHLNCIDLFYASETSKTYFVSNLVAWLTYMFGRLNTFWFKALDLTMLTFTYETRSSIQNKALDGSFLLFFKNILHCILIIFCEFI